MTKYVSSYLHLLFCPCGQFTVSNKVHVKIFSLFSLKLRMTLSPEAPFMELSPEKERFTQLFAAWEDARNKHRAVFQTGTYASEREALKNRQLAATECATAVKEQAKIMGKAAIDHLFRAIRHQKRPLLNELQDEIFCSLLDEMKEKG